MTWEDRAACRRPEVDADLFHPTSGPAGKRQAGQALHVCWSHCPVRIECHTDAERHKPSVPQILGGVRYVAQGCRTPEPSKRRLLPTTAGCGICREEP